MYLIIFRLFRLSQRKNIIILYQNETQELEDQGNEYESNRLTSSTVSHNDPADPKWMICIYKHGSN